MLLKPSVEFGLLQMSVSSPSVLSICIFHLFGTRLVRPQQHRCQHEEQNRC